jgi:biopolymer transport protein ExbD
MAMGSFESSGSGQPLSEINTTPLVDVMLVLLVIFIITAPLMTRAISLDLPKADAPAVAVPDAAVLVGISASGNYFIGKRQVSLDEVRSALQAAANRSRTTPIHLRAERDTRYALVVDLMSMAHGMGLTQLVFVTDPTTVAAPASER